MRWKIQNDIKEVSSLIMAEMNGTGQGGKSFQDRELAARVRTLALGEIEKILKKPKHKLYGAVIVKLAGTVLPRLNEVTGLGGDPLELIVRFIDADDNEHSQGVQEAL